MTPKEIFDIKNKENLENYKKVIATFSEDELKSEIAADEATKILKDAQTPYWLFYETKDPRGLSFYAGRNWMHNPYDKDGDFTSGGLEFLNHHINAMFYSIRGILQNICVDWGLEVNDDNIHYVFHHCCLMHWNSISSLIETKEESKNENS